MLLVLPVLGLFAVGCGKDTPPAPVGDAASVTVSSTTSLPAAGVTSATALPTTTVTTAIPGTIAGGPKGSAPGTVVPGTGPAATAPCTVEAVKEALTAANLELSDPPKFACESIWAYAYAKVPKENSAPASISILQANGPRWAVVDKATACTGPAVAPSIRQIACQGF